MKIELSEIVTAALMWAVALGIMFGLLAAEWIKL